MTDTAPVTVQDGWVPEFEGQRPPFEPGNTAALKSGAHSPRKVEELARRIDADLLDRAPWVAEYPEALGAYARAESVARLLYQDVARNGAYDRSGQFRASLLARYNAAENSAAKHREALGLTPRSEAQVARDRAMATSHTVDVVAELISQGKATRAERETAEPTSPAALRAPYADDPAPSAPAEPREQIGLEEGAYSLAQADAVAEVTRAAEAVARNLTPAPESGRDTGSDLNREDTTP